MKVYSDTLTKTDLVDALDGAKHARLLGPAVFLTQLDKKPAKKRAHLFVVQLAAVAKLPGEKRRRTNTGTSGAGDAWTASWDEWGYFMAEVFARDESAVFGPYEGVDNFREMTKYAYGIPNHVLA